jgi:hypothetical protein
MGKVKLTECRRCGMPGVATSTLESVTGTPRKFYILCMCRESEYFDTAEEAVRHWTKTNAERYDDMERDCACS